MTDIQRKTLVVDEGGTGADRRRGRLCRYAQ